MLKKDTQGRQLYVLRKISTSEILKRNVLYPNVDESAPVAGLDPDLEYLKINEETLPEVDAAYFSKVRTEGADSAGGLYNIVEEAERRPLTETKDTARNIRAMKTNVHVNPQEAIDRLTRLVATLYRRIEGLVLTAREQEEVTALTGVGVKLWANDDVLKDKITKIDAGQTPDLHTGYVPEM